MKKKVLIICGIAAMLLAGCTKSNIVTGGPAEPVFETQEGIVLDWGQIGDDLDEQYLNNEDYPKAVSINYSVDPDKKVNEITREERRGLAEATKALEFTLTGLRGYKEAIITQGGISVKDVNPSTMESKKIRGLYFAGEILDLDAVTGDFNLQIAWSTGWAAGKAASS